MVKPITAQPEGFFLPFFRKALDQEQQRVAYYPGSQDKFKRFKDAFQGVEEHGSQAMQTNGFKTMPWLLKTGLTPEQVSPLDTCTPFMPPTACLKPCMLLLVCWQALHASDGPTANIACNRASCTAQPTCVSMAS